MVSILLQDLRLVVRTGAGFWLVVVFFMFVVFFITLGIGPDRALHNRIAPSALWIGAVFSLLLNLDRLLYPDFMDGTIEKIMASQIPLEEYVLAKMIFLTTVSGIPIAVLAPILGIIVNFPLEHGLVAALTLLTGAPALASVGCFGSALVLIAHRGHLLQTTTVLPFCVPVVILGTLVIKTYQTSHALGSEFFLLAGLSLLSFAVFPMLTAMALRANILR